ncbi:MFS transporter [Kineosporia sp. NBRC 101677]|uniref:MFS transporter n=1 Tax=Kineosporia sp. NBRC 101677 TaxID=3032197 RepID=UPI0024A4A2B2|nr:MFS transporter [Kineosporia sp. NBRC 101677]GLY15431.1 MFS transporter [Kineosporia sp. NBRC 101677]
MEVNRAAARVQIGLIAVVQVLALAVWFSATAVAPTLRGEWGLSSAEAVWLTATVQIGFAVGAVLSSGLGLADRFPPQLLMAGSAVGAGACTALLALTADGLAQAVPLRALTGVFLAGVYPVGMKLTASWTAPADRGRAFGILIGALTLGSALPQVILGTATLPWRGVMLTAAALALVASVVAALAVKPGPLLAGGSRPQLRHVFDGFRRPLPRLANLGYFGHMWELYALWTWLPTFVLASQAAHAGRETLGSVRDVGLTSFAAIGLAGVVGCLLGGWASDRFGRATAAGAALAVSGLCCVLSPLAFGRSPALLLVFVCVWGAAVIADSGVFSTALSETADQRYVGTSLTVQTACGFSLTVVTIQLVPVLASAVGWQYALAGLGLGPLVGVVAMARFGRLQQPSR